MSAIITVPEFRSYLRQGEDDDLSWVLQQALDAAQGTAERFIGFPLIEFDTDPIPPEIKSAIVILAQLEVDAIDVPKEQQMRARAESLLRPYRKETGFAGSGVAA